MIYLIKYSQELFFLFHRAIAFPPSLVPSLDQTQSLTEHQAMPPTRSPSSSSTSLAFLLHPYFGPILLSPGHQYHSRYVSQQGQCDPCLWAAAGWAAPFSCPPGSDPSADPHHLRTGSEYPSPAVWVSSPEHPSFPQPFPSRLNTGLPSRRPPRSFPSAPFFFSLSPCLLLCEAVRERWPARASICVFLELAGCWGKKAKWSNA